MKGASTNEGVAQPSAAAPPLKRRFAENLIAHRHRAGLSQEQTAHRAGLHLTEVGLLEREMRLPRLDTIVKLAGALEAEPCELLAGMSWRHGRSTRRPGSYLRRGSSGSPKAGR